MKAEKPRRAAGMHAAELDDFHQLFAREQGFGDRLADKVAAVGGSWAFIIGFSLFLVLWAPEHDRPCQSRLRSFPIHFP